MSYDKKHNTLCQGGFFCLKSLRSRRILSTLGEKLLPLFFDTTLHFLLRKETLLILLHIFLFCLSLGFVIFTRNAFFETFTVRQIQRMMKSQFHCSRKIRFLRERSPPFDECLARVFFSQLPHKTQGFYRTFFRVLFIEERSKVAFYLH